MAHLVRYVDNNVACWCRIDLDNGDPIWISVAKEGVVAKRPGMGLTGKKL